MNAATRFWGCYVKRCDTALWTPADAATNTAATVTLTAKAVDPLCRDTLTTFYLDRIVTFNTPNLQTSSQVIAKGGQFPSWVSASISNFSWVWRARTSATIGGVQAGVTGIYSPVWTFAQAGGAGIPRSLYLYENRGIWALGSAGVGSNARSLYLYENRGIWAISILARDLYLYVNRGIQALSVLARSLYLYEAKQDGEVFPYLNHINPGEQYIGGQVDLYGDGFGQFLDATGATITVSSTNGSNIKDYAVDRLSNEWQSTSGVSSWIRFTFGAPKRIVAIVLEGSKNGTVWGRPRFTFDDASQQDGAEVVPATSTPMQSSEYPVGAARQIYWLATPKVSTYVDISVVPATGSGTNRGFSEVWVIEEPAPAQNAETSRAVMNLGLPYETTMGIVAWLNRSPNWWPANSGVALLPAATITVSVDSESGLMYVEEST